MRMMKGWTATVVILNPMDEFAIDSERTSSGEYVAAGWMASAQTLLYQMRRVVTPAIAQGTAIILDPAAVMLLEREPPTVIASNSHADFFIKNLVALRAECRLAQAILNPDAIAEVTLPAPAPGRARTA